MTTTQKPFNGDSHWIWSEEGLGAMPAKSHDNYRVRFFRREFAAAEGSRLVAHVSADSRYVFWCNGEVIDRGPARGDITHHFYETYDLTPYLRTGTQNVLAAMVIYCGDVMPTYFTTGAPCGLMTAAPGFIVDAVLTDEAGNTIEALHTDEKWQVRSDTGAYNHIHCPELGSYTGFTERFHGANYPWGWNGPNYRGDDFGSVTKLMHGVRPDNVRDSFMPHRLMPRPIPQMETTPQRFQGIESNDSNWLALISEDAPLDIAANSRVSVILNQAVLTTALPRLRWMGGAGSKIRLTYAEALTQDGIRQYNQSPEGDVEGLYDEVFPGGGNENWQSWSYRTYRYVKVDIETVEASLTIQSLDSEFWAYPYELQANFQCDDPFFDRLLDAGFRTLRLCSHETYEDCPYHEQLSYAGDNYVTAYSAALLSGDPRLTAHTLREFFWSRHPEGLTMSRYPCRMPQIIPAWSQFWLLTVYTHYRFTGDLELVRDVRDGLDSVLGWFEGKRENAGEGLVGALNYWCVLDWSPDWGEGTADSGVPPGTYVEASAANNFLHIWCLRASSELHAAIGNAEKAAKYRSKAEKLAELTHKAFWNAERATYRDRTTGNDYSQLTNALSILSDTLPREHWKELAPRLPDPKMNRTGYFGQQFVFDAMAKAGKFGECWPNYDVYRKIVEEGGNTTLPEAPSEPRRSECHAWSTGCVNSLFTHALGLQPLEPAWNAILIEPQPGPCQWLSGKVPTPNGEVAVELKQKDGIWTLLANTPANIPVTVRLPNQPELFFPKGGVVKIGRE